MIILGKINYKPAMVYPLSLERPSKGLVATVELRLPVECGQVSEQESDVYHMAIDTSFPRLPGNAIRPPEPARSDNEISTLDLLIAMAQRKWLILGVTAAVALVSTIVSLLLPVRYTATAVLLPPQQNSSLGTQLSSQLSAFSALAAGGGNSLLKNPNDMYVSMLKSRAVEDALITRFGLLHEYHQQLFSDARKKFESRSSVDGSSKDGLIRLSVEDSDPKRAAELTTGWVDQFRELSEHVAITEAAQRRVFFQQQMVQTKNQLANAEAALVQTEQKTGVIQLDSQARALIETAAALRAQITAKEVQIQAMQTYATGQNAQLVQATEELDALQAQLARLQGTKDFPGGGIIPRKAQVTAAGMEYIRRLRDVKYYETVFEILARQFEIAKLDEARQGSIIQVMDPAIVPDKRSSPMRTLIVLGSTIIGFIVSVIAVLGMHLLDRVKEDPIAWHKWNSLLNLIWARAKASEKAVP